MKIFSLLQAALISIHLLITVNICAQHTTSFDLAAIRNLHSGLKGLNVSCFYHFNDKLTGGVEINRFFPASKNTSAEKLRLSAWDIDLNFHYIVPLQQHLKFYPLTGISYTAEKENGAGIDEVWYRKEHFFSFNTGAGLLLECGRWCPHVEYSYTWGHINQQFLLAGVSYELEWSHPGNERK